MKRLSRNGRMGHFRIFMMTVLIRIRSVLEKELSAFSLRDIIPSAGWRDYGVTSAYWIIPAALYVLLVENLGWLRKADDLYKVIKGESDGPGLWNVMGALGLLLLGISIATSKTESCHKLLAKLSHGVLVKTFEIGLLTFGILLGKLIFAFEKANIPMPQIWLRGVCFFLQFAIVFAMNTFTWCLAQSIYNTRGKAAIMYKISILSLSLNLFIGFLVAVVSVAFILMSRAKG